MYSFVAVPQVMYSGEKGEKILFVNVLVLINYPESSDKHSYHLKYLRDTESFLVTDKQNKRCVLTLSNGPTSSPFLPGWNGNLKLV